VVDFCRQTWGLSPGSADRLLALARQQIRSDWDKERPQVIADLLGQLSTLPPGSGKMSPLSSVHPGA